MVLLIEMINDSTTRRTRDGLAPPIVRLFFLVLPLTVIASCMVGPDYKTPSSKIEQEWTVENNPAIKEGNTFGEYWWKALDDPVLNRLVEAAATNNLSLQIAGVRILQSRAQLNKSIGNLFPQQQAVSGAVNYSRLNDLPSVIPGLTPDYTSDQVLFAATWEIDVWGKFRRGIESDRAEFVATVASYDDALVTLIADLAATYVNIRTAEQRTRVANSNIVLLTESLRVANARYKGGETSELDVQQASTVLSQTLASIPDLINAAQQSKNALAVLLGETPDRVDDQLKGGEGIPVAPKAVMVGIPRDLLRRRPDVREAGLTAASQSALIGVARAQMYPAFSLSGAFGFSSSDEGNSSLADMFSWESRAVKTGASFVFPIFNYGQLVNQVRVQDAQFQQAILNYQNTVLTAQQEVENGLSAFTTSQTSLTHFAAAAGSARRSSELAMAQYKAGETDYTTVLSAEQFQLSIDDSLVSAQGNVVQGVIAVYRALGGGWEIRNGRDVVSDAVKAEMAERTNWGDLLDPKNHLPEESPEAEPGTSETDPSDAGN